MFPAAAVAKYHQQAPGAMTGGTCVVRDALSSQCALLPVSCAFRQQEWTGFLCRDFRISLRKPFAERLDTGPHCKSTASLTTPLLAARTVLYYISLYYYFQKHS
jgi:hypothetical protein